MIGFPDFCHKLWYFNPFIFATQCRRFQTRAYTEINLGGGKICAKRKIFFCPPLGASRGGQNSNCKFITLGFLDIRHKYKILKRHTYSPNNYLLSTTLSLLQTKLAEKKHCFQFLQVFSFFKWYNKCVVKGEKLHTALRIRGEGTFRPQFF